MRFATSTAIRPSVRNQARDRPGPDQNSEVRRQKAATVARS